MGPVLNSFLGYQGRPGEEIGGSFLAGSPLRRKASKNPLPPKGGLVACLLSHSWPCPPYLVPSDLPHPARQGQGCGAGLAPFLLPP